VTWGEASSRSSLSSAEREGALRRLTALGFSDDDAGTLADHFLDAERRGKLGHGLARVDWLATLEDLDPAARPELVLSGSGFERWDGGGALGYLTLAAICDSLLAQPPEHARVVVAANTFPTGMLGYWVRRLAEGGLAAALTATSPPRLAHPDGGDPLVGTTPLAIGVPSSDSKPLVADVSMGKVTYGDVIAGHADAVDLVPFGGEQAHKAFALAAGLQLLVEALGVETHGALLVVARPGADPVPAFRALAAELRLPGDS
jgi:LDH2 family malate/lactate/ureidoglycolate dehydrogenase